MCGVRSHHINAAHVKQVQKIKSRTSFSKSSATVARFSPNYQWKLILIFRKKNAILRVQI